MSKTTNLSALSDVVSVNDATNLSTFSGDIVVSNATPSITLNDTDNSLGATMFGSSGHLYLRSYSTSRDVYIGESTTGNNNLIVTGDGYVTMPYQPAFYMSNTTDSLVWKGGTVELNVGNHFNNTTGYFTAPVAGMYTFTVYGQSLSNPYWAGVHLNGSYKATFYKSGTHYGHGSATCNLYMQAGDYVQATATYGVTNTGGQSGFSGYLIG